MKFQLKKQLPICLVLFLSAFVNVWNLWEEGLGNLYYSAGAYSMGQNLHAFFFNSLDSVGFISIDKPPLGLWIQVVFTKVFGFGGMVLLLPQAIAGILSVYFLYKMIDRRFGQSAGILSALVLALTPIFVAVSRNNTMDGILILMLIFASEQLLKAAEKSSLKHLILACVFIGLGFNIKMLQSYMIVPAAFITYFIFSGKVRLFPMVPSSETAVPSSKKGCCHAFIIKIISCLSALAILLVVSFSWIAIVDLTPAQNRPYVGSSGTNSALSLALGYNGINRLLGNAGSNENERIPPPGSGDMQNHPISPNNGGSTQDDIRPAPQNNSGAPKAEGGSPSVLRLLNNQIAGQISWFLVPALFVSLLCLFRIIKAAVRKNTRKAFLGNSKNIALTYFTMCFIPMLLYFSFSGGLAHRYYLAMFAFPIAALIGIGFSILQEQIRDGRRILVFLAPAVFGITAIVQLYIQSLYSDWLPLLLPACAILFTVAIAGMIAAVRLKKPRWGIPLLIVLLILPGVWAFTPIIYGDNAQLPIAGPELAEQSNVFSKQSDLKELAAFLKENRGDADYIASVPDAIQLGAELILESGEPVMVLGGFNGGDSPITLEEYKTMIRSGKVSYAVVSSDASPTGSSNAALSDWIVHYCKVVDIRINGFTLYKLSLD